MFKKKYDITGVTKKIDKSNTFLPQLGLSYSDENMTKSISSVKNDFGVKNYNKDFDNSKTS